MIIEAVLLIGLMSGGLYILSEMSKKRMLGVIASLLLIILALWVFTDGVQFGTGFTSIGGALCNCCGLGFGG